MMEKYYNEVLEKFEEMGVNPSDRFWYLYERRNEPLTLTDKDGNVRPLFTRTSPLWDIYYSLYRAVEKVWDTICLPFSRWWWKNLLMKKRTGANYYDLWDIGYDFHKWLLPRMTLYLSVYENDDPKIVTGVPAAMFDKPLPAELTPEEEKVATDRWVTILREIKWAAEFGSYNECDLADDWAWVRYYNGMRLFGEWSMAMWT